MGIRIGKLKSLHIPGEPRNRKLSMRHIICLDIDKYNCPPYSRTSAAFANPDRHRDGRASPKALPAARGQRTSAAFAKASAAKGLPTSDFRLPTSDISLKPLRFFFAVLFSPLW